jgi:hypothetical protein
VGVQKAQALIKDSLTIHIESNGKLEGRGTLRRDSVIITGESRKRSTVLLKLNQRLPASVFTQGDGRMRIQLRDSTAYFRQEISHSLIQRPKTAPPE